MTRNMYIRGGVDNCVLVQRITALFSDEGGKVLVKKICKHMQKKYVFQFCVNKALHHYIYGITKHI